MEKTNYYQSRSQSYQEKSSSRRNYDIEWNLKESNKRTRSSERIRERERTRMGKQWNNLYGRKNLHFK